MPLAKPSKAGSPARPPTVIPTAPPIFTLPPKRRRRAIIATLIGNALEHYDFVIYAYFSLTIARLFFPQHAPTAALLLSVSIYGTGFVMRPLGAVLFGVYADRYGRRSALTITLSLMGLGTLCIACAPTHAQVGVLAPLLLILGRMLQGFSLGGEVGTSVTALIEIDPLRQRGLRSALESASAAFAGIAAAGVVLIITHSLAPDAVSAWGWRIPFLIGALGAPAGVLLRYQLADDRPTVRPPSFVQVTMALRPHWKPLVLSILMMQGAMIGYTMAGAYLPVHAMQWLGRELKTVHWIGMASSTTVMLVTPLFGMWSDRVGRRKPFAVIGRLSTAIIVIPAYWVINHYPSLPVIMALAALMKVCLSISAATTLALISESFPREVRATAVSIAHALASTVFASSTQVVVIGLIVLTGNLLAPAIYASCCLLVAVAAATLLKETGAQPLR